MISGSCNDLQSTRVRTIQEGKSVLLNAMRDELQGRTPYIYTLKVGCALAADVVTATCCLRHQNPTTLAPRFHHVMSPNPGVQTLIAE
jgi:hypothetical protein